MGRTTVHNILVTEEKWTAVSDKNKELINDFLEYKKGTGKSEETIYQYKHILRMFFVWNSENNENKFFVDIKKRDLSRFFNYVVIDLKSSPNRTRTISAVLSSLSNYIENILDDEYEDYRNSIKKIEPVAKAPVRDKTILTKEEVDKCLNGLLDDGKFQIACFMALAAASGARKSELLRFKVDYFKDENIVMGCLYKTPEKIVTKGHGRQGKLLTKYTFVAQFKPYYDRWMQERKKLGIDCEYLFVVKGKEGWKKAETHTANRWSQVISEYLEKDFYFHSLRHYLISELRAKKLPDPVIIELIGWEKSTGSNMIAIYDDNDVLESFSQYFNENGIIETESARITDI